MDWSTLAKVSNQSNYTKLSTIGSKRHEVVGVVEADETKLCGRRTTSGDGPHSSTSPTWAQLLHSDDSIN